MNIPKYILIVFILLLYIGCETEEYPYYIKADIEFAVILDNTATMGPFFEPAKEALKSLVNSLKDEDRMLFIITANGSPYIWKESSNNKTELVQSIDDLTHSANLHDERYDLAIKLAVDNFSSGKLGCILLIGDGFIHSFYDPDVSVLYNTIKSDTDKKAAVYPISFKDTPGNSEVLEEIAAAGNGIVITLESPGELGKEYERLKVEALTHIYE